MSDLRDKRVRVVMLHGRYFPGQSLPAFEATLRHRPRGAGDTYQLELDDGRMLELNGNSSVFVGLHELAGEPDDG